MKNRANNGMGKMKVRNEMLDAQQTIFFETHDAVYIDIFTGVI